MDKFLKKYDPSKLILILEDGNFKYVDESYLGDNPSILIDGEKIIIETCIENLAISISGKNGAYKAELCDHMNMYPADLLVSNRSVFIMEIETYLNQPAAKGYSFEDKLKVIITKVVDKFEKFINDPIKLYE